MADEQNTHGKVERPALQLPKNPAMVDAAAITINLMRPYIEKKWGMPLRRITSAVLT